MLRKSLKRFRFREVTPYINISGIVAKVLVK